ncbi:MAG: DEAD/DEAH box helicase [Citromicrobium sp.]|nr:DEAD/DEAH box helicase [Citromicrobium sp.]|tara:strand:+ start:2592 stop:5372 length:2781 start_codon:yes stop_codon:yes gene_type:complete
MPDLTIPTAFKSGGHLARFSSRQGKLASVYLSDRLKSARKYDRIAGYFRSSIFEIVGEELANIEDVRIVANSDLDFADIQAAKAVRDAALFRRFVEGDSVLDAALHRDRYRQLHELLTSQRIRIKVVPRSVAPFLHGKAGIITANDGAQLSFMGSINETRAAWAHNYELVWEDSSAEGVEWVQAEFDALWDVGVDLPDVVIKEVGRLAKRHETTVEGLALEEIPGAALVESPLYRDGASLQRWQRAFVGVFLQHRQDYGKVRLLLADEVGVGKTLSLAASALLSVLLSDGPCLILVPSTLTEQWQIELKDRLGMPTARWDSLRKCWIDPDGRIIKGQGVADVARCPYAIGIVSTGLIVHGMADHGRAKEGTEAECLLSGRYGTVILDEAHKARGSQPPGASERSPNNLLSFMIRIAERTQHLLLSTATPIQTSVDDLWDLLTILNRGADFVLGNAYSPWAKSESSVPILTGAQKVTHVREGWDFLVNPMPPSGNDDLIADLREEFGMSDTDWALTKLPADIMNPATGMKLELALTMLEGGLGYFQRGAHNPLLRHVVLRKRRDLEEMGLIPKLPVDIHPNADLPLPSHIFDGLSIATSPNFEDAYQAAERFTLAYRRRTRAAGFMKTLLLQRICSSHAAGIATAEALLGKRELDDEALEELEGDAFAAVEDERAALQDLIDALTDADDPKLRAVRYFLDDHQSGSRTWREMGAIIFSQYYDTAAWIGEQLAKEYPEQPIAIYAGAGKSRILKGGESTSAERAAIKKLVAEREISLVVATDAACEGLNLQTLGTLINVDLPWNPSKLEQRIGRIKRFGQTRERVDMANLTYVGTVDEKVYRVLSERLKTTHDLLGTMPETIDADWIEDIENLEERLRTYTNPRERSDPFKARYANALVEDETHWDEASAVLARHDVEDMLSRGWASK